MTYKYPPIGATIPEETPAVPATVYEFWVVSRISNVVDQIIDRDPDPGQADLEPVGNMTIRGRKYSSVNNVINPTGEETAITSDELFQLLEANPEFATAYNAFVLACGTLLDIQQVEKLLRTATGAEFEALLRKLRTDYQEMDRDDDAAKVTIAIQKFPQEWDEQEVLLFLHLIAEDPTIVPA